MSSSRVSAAGVESERNVESATMAVVVERYPLALSEHELIAIMSEQVCVRRLASGVSAVQQAVRELVGVGLLDRRDAQLLPTPAALRSSEPER